MTGSEKAISMLEDLVETCRDGQNGYRDAAEHVTDSNLRHFFNQQSLERAGFAAELEEELIKLGEKTRIAAAALVRQSIERGSTPKPHSAAEITPSLRASNQANKATNSYAKAAQFADLPEYLAAIVRKQYAGIQAAHDHIRRLRDTRAA